MEGKIYETIAVGCSFLSLGYALTHKDTLIIERSELCDSEFSGAYNPGKNWNLNQSCKQVQDLSEGLRREGLILPDGTAFIEAIPAFLYDFINRKNINILLLCDVISCVEHDGVYQVETYTNSGKKVYYAKKLLDTTADGVFGKRFEISEKSITAIAVNISPNINAFAKKSFGDKAEVYKSFFDDRRLIKISLPKECDMQTARKIIHDSWKNGLSQSTERIALIANCFSLKTSEKQLLTGENALHMPACNFDNGIAAFSCGCNLEIQGMMRCK